MGCCCCGGEAEEDHEADHAHYRANPGPKVDRGCTDIAWLLLYVVFLLGLAAVWLEFREVSDVYKLTHGMDHEGQRCGIGHDVEDKKYVYFPRLEEDFRDDWKLTHKYGVCVEECPEPTVKSKVQVADYGEKKQQDHWWVTYPSFAVANRCIPYEDPNDISRSSTKLCASPPCSEVDRVCGVKRDGTDYFWLLDEPDQFLQDAWRQEGKTSAEIEAMIAKVKAYKSNPGKCEAEFLRETRLRNNPLQDQSVLTLLTFYTGIVTRQVRAIYDNLDTVLLFGLLGTLLAATLVIVFFSCCVRVVVNVLIVLLFVSLTVADYILFVQAGIFTGRTGTKILRQIGGEAFANETREAIMEERINFVQGETLNSIYTGLAYGLCVVIVLLVCTFGALQSNLKMLYALLDETASVVLAMPSLLLVPFFAFCSMSACSVAMTWLAMYLTTMEFEPTQQKAREFGLEAYVTSIDDLENLQKIGGFILIFSWLWIYFMHVATFIAVCAGCVSHWYFFRDDPNHASGTGRGSAGYFFGRPILYSFMRIARYHFGSLAYGSFIMALATLPRIVLEYIAAQSTEENEVVKCAITATRCLLWCLQKCLEFLTEYAYVYVAVTGDRFCKSARKSFMLFAEYPVQVTLDKLASTLLSYAACFTVPTIMGLLAYMCADVAPLAITFVVAVLSYFTTRLTVRVYDVCCTALFVCVCRDSKYHDGKYMPPGLKKAFKVVRNEDVTDETELTSREAIPDPDKPPNW